MFLPPTPLRNKNSQDNSPLLSCASRTGTHRARPSQGISEVLASRIFDLWVLTSFVLFFPRGIRFNGIQGTCLRQPLDSKLCSVQSLLQELKKEEQCRFLSKRAFQSQQARSCVGFSRLRAVDLPVSEASVCRVGRVRA